MKKHLLAGLWWLFAVGCASGLTDDVELTTSATEGCHDEDEAGSSVLPTASRDASADDSASLDADAPVDGGLGATVDAGIDAPAGPVCGEATCVPVTVKELGNHFTGPGCTGIESYYTLYNSNDGIRRSWDGKGLAGTILRTETVHSFKNATGVCTNFPASGYTLSNFVRIYR